MTTEVSIRYEGVSVSLDDPLHDAKGWLESYRVSLSANGLSATVRVENPPYGTAPSQFFSLGYFKYTPGKQNASR